MSTPPAQVLELFGQQERVKQIVRCRLPLDDEGDIRHWLVVVGHGDEHDEQGGVLVIKDSRGDFEISDVIAVTAGFRVTVGQHQVEREESAVESASELTVVFESAKARISVICGDSEDVKKVVSDVKLLAVIASENRLREGTSHAWLEPYIREGSQGSSKGPKAQTSSVKTSPGWFWSKESNATSSSSTATEAENPLNPSFPAVQWLRTKLRERQDEFSQRKPTHIHLATYNVNDLLPRDEDDLRSVIGVNEAAEESDLIVVGLQEVDLRNQSLIMSASSERDDAWVAAFLKAMGPKASLYELLCKNKFVGVLQVIFVKKTERDSVSGIEMCEKPIGLLGLMGNKAGVAARLKMHDSTFCFVTAHLAAFANADDKRRENYEELMRGLTFPRRESETPAFDGPGEGISATPADSDFLFFLGDLNFRIALPDEQVHQLVDKEDWQGMLKYDQLRAQIAAGKAFAGFREGNITFRPSFKYKHGTLDIDKKRGAAFTDRVVWRTRYDRDAVQSVSYISHPEVLLSDHLPVSATTNCQVLVVDEKRRQEVYTQVLDELAELRKEYTPVLICQPQSLDFGDALPGEGKVQSITLSNSGTRATVDYCVSTASGSMIFWASPARGKLSPGDDKCVKINFRVTNAHVDDLNRGKLSLKDTINISVTGGEPRSVSVTARHLPTCFGASLDWLSRLSGAARDGKMIDEGASPITSPRELWRMIEVLMRDGKDAKGLFTETADFEIERRIKEAIDKGECLDGILQDHQATIAVGDLLVQFLERLAEPVIPSQQQDACTSATTRDEAYACLDLLPHINTNVLISITALLRFLLEGEAISERLDDYAAIFAACLFRGSSGPSSAEQVSNRRRFIKLLIDI